MRVIVLLATCGFLTVTPVLAEIGIYAAYWDTKDIGDSIGPGIKYVLELSPVIRAEARLSYQATFDSHHQDVAIYPLELSLVGNIYSGAQYSTYLGAGAGYYIIEGGFKWPGANLEPDSQNDFGYFILAGIEMPLREDISLFAEAAYNFLSADKGKAVGDHLHTLKLGGFGANAGVTYRW